jgi:hypothetical protein
MVQRRHKYDGIRSVMNRSWQRYQFNLLVLTRRTDLFDRSKQSIVTLTNEWLVALIHSVKYCHETDSLVGIWGHDIMARTVSVKLTNDFGTSIKLTSSVVDEIMDHIIDEDSPVKRGGSMKDGNESDGSRKSASADIQAGFGG